MPLGGLRSMDDPKNIIYGLTDPRDGALRYVGQSCKGIKRAYQHQSVKNQKWNPHKNNWVCKLQSLGLVYGVVVIERLDNEDKLNEREAWWIALGRAWGCRLLNATAGGDGVRGLQFSKESRAKMSASQNGRRHSEETKAKIGAKSRGRVVSEKTKEKLRNRPLNPRAMKALEECRNSDENCNRLRQLAESQRGVPYTEERRQQMKDAWRRGGEKLRGHSPGAETRAKMSAAARGRKKGPRTAEHRANLSAALTGRKFSSETIERMRVAQTGKTPSPETRAKLSEAHRGLKRSAETREKMRRSATGKTHSPETRAKMSAAKLGRKISQPRSAEWRAKVSATNRGKKRSPEQLERIRAARLARLGAPVSDETRAKQSAASLGRTHTPETRARMSDFRRQWWADRRATKEVLSAQQGPM